MMLRDLWAVVHAPVLTLGEVVAFNALPFLVWAISTRQVSRTGKLGCFALFAALISCCSAQSDTYLVVFGMALTGMAYYVLCALLVHRLPPLLRSKALSRGALFAGLAVAFVLVPGLAVPGIAGLTFLAVGWDLMLSAYSYCVDTSRAEQKPELKECVFFLLVNPVLVFSARGVRVGRPTITSQSAGRILAGLAALLLAFAIRTLPPVDLSPSGVGASYAVLLAAGIVDFLSLYFVHSGMASVKIGAMRCLGYAVPERYHYPFLAASPLDFWRRWNIYVGTWCRRYLFYPLASRFARRHASFPTAAKILAVAGTFISMGLLHDYYTWADSHQFSLSGVKTFAVAGFVVLAWAGLRSLSQRRRVSIARPWKKMLADNLCRFCFAHAVLFVLWMFSMP